MKKTAAEWCGLSGVVVVDPEGWMDQGRSTWTTPITLNEFWSRVWRSSFKNLPHFTELRKIVFKNLSDADKRASGIDTLWCE